MNELNYMGFKGSICYSQEDNTLHGKIENIKDLVTFEGETGKDLYFAFIDAVKYYLLLCEEVGKRPSFKKIKFIYPYYQFWMGNMF